MKTSFKTIGLLVSISMSGLGETIHIGTNDFQVLFADATLDGQTETRIVADLQSEYDFFADGCLPDPNAVGGGSIRFTNVQTFPYENNVEIPKTFVGELGTTNCFIVIGTELSTKYSSHILLESSHVQMFQSANGFVQSLEDGVLLSMTSNQVGQFFYYEQGTPETLAESRDKLSHWLDQFEVRQPGLLSIFPSRDDVPSLGEVFVMGIPYIDHSNGDRRDAIPAVWIDGQWKLLLW